MPLGSDDFSGADGENPSCWRVELNAALAAAGVDTPEADDAITEVLELGQLEAQVLEGNLRLSEPVPNPGATGIRLALGSTDDRE